MSPYRGKGLLPTPGFPRVSGDEPFDVRASQINQLFSPRERG